jgi:hypothetical protein
MSSVTNICCTIWSKLATITAQTAKNWHHILQNNKESCNSIYWWNIIGSGFKHHKPKPIYWHSPSYQHKNQTISTSYILPHILQKNHRNTPSSAELHLYPWMEYTTHTYCSKPYCRHLQEASRSRFCRQQFSNKSGVRVFTSTFNNIVVIPWQSVLLVVDTEENTNLSLTNISHNVKSSTSGAPIIGNIDPSVGRQCPSQWLILKPCGRF